MRQPVHTYYVVARALACVACVCALTLHGCTEREEVEMQMMDIPVRFVLQGASTPEPAVAPTTYYLPGDPGAAETFQLPRHAYVFVVFKMKNGRADDVRYIEWNNEDTDDTNDLSWSDAILQVGDTGDVYRVCTTTITELTPVLGQVEACRVYAAMSYTALTLSTTTPSTEEAVQNITFTVNDALQPNVRDIYSTPYNYHPDGRYYAQLNVWKESPSFTVMLYHVASKIDLMWNVAEDKRDKVRVTKIKAKNLFEGSAYLFKPTKNVHAMFDGVTSGKVGYTPTDLVGDVASTWWAGRTYLYTIPYVVEAGGKFPLQVEVDLKNTDADATYTKSLTLQTTPTDTVFVPWMRGLITVETVPESDNEEFVNL